MTEHDINRLAQEFAELGLDREASLELARCVQREIDTAVAQINRKVASLEQLLAAHETRTLLRKF